jgi:hypothetical protein
LIFFQISVVECVVAEPESHQFQFLFQLLSIIVVFQIQGFRSRKKNLKIRKEVWSKHIYNPFIFHKQLWQWLTLSIFLLKLWNFARLREKEWGTQVDLNRTSIFAATVQQKYPQKHHVMNSQHFFWGSPDLRLLQKCFILDKVTWHILLWLALCGLEKWEFNTEVKLSPFLTRYSDRFHFQLKRQQASGRMKVTRNFSFSGFCLYLQRRHRQRVRIVFLSIRFFFSCFLHWTESSLAAPQNVSFACVWVTTRLLMYRIHIFSHLSSKEHSFLAVVSSSPCWLIRKFQWNIFHFVLFVCLKATNRSKKWFNLCLKWRSLTC